MELNRKVLVKVAVMLFLLGITATVEARSDAGSFIREVLPNADANNYLFKSTAAATCACTLSWPVYTCYCPGEKCYAACPGHCICVIDEVGGTCNCKCNDDETKLSPGAGAH